MLTHILSAVLGALFGAGLHALYTWLKPRSYWADFKLVTGWRRVDRRRHSMRSKLPRGYKLFYGHRPENFDLPYDG